MIKKSGSKKAVSSYFFYDKILSKCFWTPISTGHGFGKIKKMHSIGLIESSNVGLSNTSWTEYRLDWFRISGTDYKVDKDCKCT